MKVQIKYILNEEDILIVKHYYYMCTGSTQVPEEEISDLFNRLPDFLKLRANIFGLGDDDVKKDIYEQFRSAKFYEQTN